MMKNTERLFKKMLLTKHPSLLQWNLTILNHKEQTKNKIWLDLDPMPDLEECARMLQRPAIEQEQDHINKLCCN